MLTEACRRPAATGPARRRAGVHPVANSGSRPRSGVAPAVVSPAGSLAVLTVSTGLALLGTVLLGGAVPGARPPFGGGTWVTAAYAIPLGLVAAVSGRLADRAGADRVLRAGLLALTAASLLCALAWNLQSLLAFRVLQGAAAGLVPATALALLLRTVPRRRLAEALGVFGAGALLLPVATPLLGAQLGAQLGWRPLLATGALIALLAARASIAVLPRSATGERRPFDLAGLVSGGAGLTLTLLALSGGASWGWASPLTVLLALGGAAGLAGFAVVELSAEEPLLDLDGLRDPAVATASLLLVVLVACLGAGFLEAPSLLHQAQGGGPPAAWWPLLAGLCAAAALPLGGRLSDRIGPRWPAAAGLILLAYTTYLLHLTGPGTATWGMALLIALRGAGMGLALAPVMTVVLSGTSAGGENRACAAVVTLLRLPAALGLAVLTSVSTLPRPLAVTNLDSAPLQPPAAWTSVRAVLLVTAGVSGLGVLLALRLPVATTARSPRMDLAGLLAALTGTRRAAISLVGLDARRLAAAPPAPRPRRPRPGAPRPRAGGGAAATPRARTRSAATKSKAATAAAGSTARTPSRTRRTGAATAKPAPAAAPRRRPRAGVAVEAAPTTVAVRRQATGGAGAAATAAPEASPAVATPTRRTPARSAAATARRRKVEADPAA
jgi:MFS family permease